MLRIFYISAATRFATARELEDILAVSRERNRADQITGLLLYHDGSFAQILEGPEEAVRNCFERIRADGRHVGCRLILEERADDATEDELKSFIAGCNVDERASLVALAWVGRGTYEASEFAEARSTALQQSVTPTEDYLLGIPLLADYLEEGLNLMGVSVEEAEEGVL